MVNFFLNAYTPAQVGRWKLGANGQTASEGSFN